MVFCGFMGNIMPLQDGVRIDECHFCVFQVIENKVGQKNLY